MTHGDLLIRNVEVAGRPGVDVRLRRGVVAEIARGLRGDEAAIDGRGGALIPGLIDHHIHLFALAVQAASLRLDSRLSPGELAQRLRRASTELPAGEWLRGVSYHEGGTGLLDRWALDRMIEDRPVRLQHRSGGLWVLNSRALEAVLGPHETAACVERDALGRATGRIWRGDDWLRTRLSGSPPSLAGVSAELARHGVTGVTDASVTNDAEQARVFERAAATGEFDQRMMMMSGGDLAAPISEAFSVGPVKILLDDQRLPDLTCVSTAIKRAHGVGRPVAIHCVTAGELAFSLAAFSEAGARDGDRIEHGGVIHREAVGQIAQLGLTVVTQPGFIAEHGDRYLAEVPDEDLACLYPCASLLRAGIKVAGSSDAPYAGCNPWLAMAAAIERRTRSGRVIGPDERVDPRRALRLFLGSFEDPGGPPRIVKVGAPADLCLLRSPVRVTLARLRSDVVAATVVGGRLIFSADSGSMAVSAPRRLSIGG